MMAMQSQCYPLFCGVVTVTAFMIWVMICERQINIQMVN